ncbi:hypothetical protein MNV49_001671 [Pseudohyphozyma bogoriensis]|nr:hypothetical protein MNV49_001671 [Pseudohyphozyma bogoriensis]
MARASRSQFIEKLHNLLENPLDPSSLRWVSDDAFEITCHDGRARHALSPSWDFRSLSSFIRQLSYYNFKSVAVAGCVADASRRLRLSDRRRSSERRTAASGYIVFSHPSGFFLRGDPSKLHGIVRKTRNRPEKGAGRRASASSIQSSGMEDDEDDHEPPPPMPAWPPMDVRQYGGYQDDRRPLHHFNSAPSFQSSFPSVRPMHHHPEPITWRPYTPTWADDNSQPAIQRRASDYSMPPISPRSKKLDLIGNGSGPRKAGSLSIHPHAAMADDDEFHSPYPTPTFQPSYGSTSTSSTVPTGLALPYEGNTYSSYSHQNYGHGAGNVALPSPTDSVYSAHSGGADPSPRRNSSTLPAFAPQPQHSGDPKTLAPILSRPSGSDHLDPRSLNAGSRSSFSGPSTSHSTQYFHQPSPAPTWAAPRPPAADLPYQQYLPQGDNRR